MALTQVSTAGVKDDFITAAKIADDAVTSALIADDSISGALLTNNLDIPDNNKIRFGTGNDFEIFFDGSNGLIQNHVDGNIEIRANDNFNLKVNASGGGAEDAIIATKNGAVELFHDNSKKFETTSYGSASAGQLRITSSNATTVGFSCGDAGTGLYNSGSNAIGYSANGTQKWNINSSGDLRLVDSVKATFGTGDDLQLYHDGSNSTIKNISGGGVLTLKNEDNAKLQLMTQNSYPVEIKTNGENAIICNANAAVELYYDGTLKLTTLSSGVQMANGSGNNTLSLFDSDKISCGNDGDLKIYHDGSNSVIKDAGTGILAISGSEVHIQNGNNSESIAKFKGPDDNSNCEFYYNDSKKFETNSEGIQIHGKTYAEGAIDMPDDAKLLIGNGDDLEIYHDGSHSRIVDAGTGDLKIQTNGLQLLNAAGDEYYLYAIENGSVSLYHNNVQKIETQSDGVTIGGHLRPWSSRDDTDDCGRPGQRWDDIYATNTTIQTSDRNEKEAITASDLGLAFVNKLTPVSFKRKGKTRTHYGLIAQDIETVLTNISKTTTQFAGFIKSDISEKQDGSSYRYGLRMGEFTAPLIKAVQELSAEVDTLKTKVAALEAA